MFKSIQVVFSDHSVTHQSVHQGLRMQGSLVLVFPFSLVFDFLVGSLADACFISGIGEPNHIHEELNHESEKTVLNPL